MSTGQRYLRVNETRANHETADGETLILDPTTGVLTLLVGSGPVIWERLTVGVERQALSHDVTAAYGAEAATVVVAFVDELVEYGLVVDGDDPPSSSDTSTLTPWPAEFQPPGAERYDEIADIMTMDPIHEVDPSLGWPHASTDSPPRGG